MPPTLKRLYVGWKALTLPRNLSQMISILEGKGGGAACLGWHNSDCYFIYYEAYLPFVHATCMEWIEQ